MLNINDYDIDLLNLVDVENILEQLLYQIRVLTFSDAGTIYLKDGDSLRFCVFQNNSLSEANLNQSIQDRVQIKICTKADTDSLIGLNFSFPSPAGALSA